MKSAARNTLVDSWMAPKKKQPLIPGQRTIDAFFGSPNRRTDSSSSRPGDGAANTAAYTAPAAHLVSTAARAPQPINSAQQQSTGFATAGNTAVSAPLQARLSSTAAALTANLEHAVGQIAAGQLQPDGRYHLSRTARQAAGDHPQQQMQQQQHPQQQRYAEALRKAYLQVERFSSMNEEQRIAATSDITKALLILAGAGTGKTSTIISRILYLLNQGVLPRLIVVLTFTNKAAEELQTRLHQAMQEARGIAAAAVGDSIEQRQESGHFELLACTFHSFCYRLLRQYFKACGFNQCPTVWLDKDARQAIRVAMKLADVDKVRTQLARWLGCGDGWEAIQAAARAQHPELMAKWFAEQREARAKVEAAAAKTKQKAEAKRHKASEPSGRKCKAAARQPQPLGKGQQQLSFSRQACGKVARQNGASDVTSSDTSAAQQQQRMGMPPPPPAMQQQQPQQRGWQQQSQQQPQQQQTGHQMPQQQDPEQQQARNAAEQEQQQSHTADQLGGLKLQQLQLQAKIRLYELLLRHHESGDKQQEAAPTVAALKGKISLKEVKRVQKAIDGFKCRGEKPEQGLVVAQYAFYQMLLRLCNAVDFNDLLGHVAVMLESRKDILEFIQRLWPYMMVDEYQDCNAQQVRIVELLQAVLKRVTVVGDDAQSIYGFRGAAPNVFPLYKTAFGHAKLVRTLVKNYRSTPQILQVAQAVLAGSGIHPKELTPQASADGKPPVRLLLVDSEEHEAEVIAKEAKRLHESKQVKYGEMAVLFRAFRINNGKSHTKLQKALTREGVPFVLVRDVSMFERKEVLDVLAYLTLALKPDDDAAFMRVINVPNRRLGKKFEEKLLDEQQRFMAAYAEQQQQQHCLPGGNKQQAQQQQDWQEQPSFHSIARRLLAEGQVATLHESRLREFLAVLERLYADVRGQTPAEAVVTILRGVPGLVADIIKQRDKNRKLNQGEEAAAAPAEEQGEEEEQAEPAEHDTGSRQQQQQHRQPHDSSCARGSDARAGSSGAAPAGRFQSARQAFNHHQQQQQQQGLEDQPSTMSGSHMAPDDCYATAAATADSDADSEEESDSGSGDCDELETALERPKELVTPALGCLYDEAVAFGAKWALENNVSAATAAAAAGDAAAAPGSQEGTAAAAAGGRQAAAAAAEPVGAPSLYELMAAQLTQLWSARQLLQSGLPEFLLEELFAALGKGSRPLADFHAHIALNPNTEPAAHSKAAQKQKQEDQGRADALVISTIHAAKGLEYNTVWVPRWVEGFLPAFPRKADLERLEGSEMLKYQEDFFKEEQRLAHVSLSRPKERLYLTRPMQQYESRRQSQHDAEQQVNDLQDIAMGRQTCTRDEFVPSRFLKLLEPLLGDQAVYRQVNLCKDSLTGASDTAWYDL